MHNQLYYGCAHRPILQSVGGWSGGREAREDYGTRSFGCYIENCVHFKLEVEEWGVCPPPPSQLQWLASSPPTSLVDRRSTRGGGGLVDMRVGGGVRVGVYRVVEGMGITNFTMVVPTVQSSRAWEDGVVGGRLEKTTELVRSAARSRIVSISS